MSRLARMEPSSQHTERLTRELAAVKAERDALREACRLTLRLAVEGKRLRPAFQSIIAALSMPDPALTDAEKTRLREAVAEPLPYADGGHAVCPPADFE